MYALSSTSALILLWTHDTIYESTSARRFLESVDLNAGAPLRARLDTIWDHIDEEITNRKFGVKKFSADFLASCPDAQVVFVGAGLDPKSLDVAELFPRSSVFDVDMENMELKKEIVKSIGGPENIRFCQANIADAGQLSSALREKGWDSRKTTLAVAEGISYYVGKEPFRNSLAALKGTDGGLVLEYCVPDEDIENPERRGLYTAFFTSLQAGLGLPESLTRYRVDEVSSLAAALGGRVVETLNQRELERARTGENGYYDIDPGGVRVSLVRYGT